MGTYGAIKGLEADDMDEMGYGLMLGNTYHLSNTPGADLMEELGGLHSFMGFEKALLTDSGGFQMVSLLSLSKVTEEGVSFKNPKNGEKLLLTPEKSVHLQNQIGADIIMALDDVVSSLTPNSERGK